jgi:hypothetical protein
MNHSFLFSFQSIKSFSKYRLIFGLENGLVVIDYLIKTILMNMVTSDLYGTMDPFQRATLSPKRRGPSNESNNDESNVFSYEYQVNYFIKKFFFSFSSNNNFKKKSIQSSIDH